MNSQRILCSQKAGVKCLCIIALVHFQILNVLILQFCKLIHSCIATCTMYMYHSSNYWNTKVIAKSNAKQFAVTFKRKKEQQILHCNSWKSNIYRDRSVKKRSKELIHKKKAKKIKSNSFIMSKWTETRRLPVDVDRLSWEFLCFLEFLEAFLNGNHS